MSALMAPKRLDISKLPAHLRQKLQAMRDEKEQWIDACYLLLAIGGIEDKKEARAVWVSVLDELEENKGRQWRIEVNRKAAEQYKKEQSR